MRTAACLLLLLLVQASVAQRRNANLIFGDDIWLDFTADTLLVRNSPYYPTNRTASISDPAGNLLFIADETGIRDTTFSLMSGAEASQLGWPDRLSAVLILPKPDAPTRYIVFVNTPEWTKQAGWVEVDMAMNNGLGGVVSSSTTWYMNNCTAKLAATTHGNGTDYWVMQHADGNNEYNAFRLTSTGLLSAPVISATGLSLAPTPLPAPLSSDFWAPMSFSPMGDKLAMGARVLPDSNGATVASFDQLTGAVDHIASVPLTVHVFSSGNVLNLYHGDHMITGIDFLRNGEFFFIASTDTTSLDGSGSIKSCQIDLRLLNEDSMRTSTLHAVHFEHGLGEPWARDTLGSSILLAPDGELYVRGTWYQTAVLSKLKYTPLVLVDPLPEPQEFVWSGGFRTLTGFPLFCKRYHDSEPVWLSMDEATRRSVELCVRPNPMDAFAMLALPEGIAAPDQLIWTDAMGRAVRMEKPRCDGESLLLERGDLPAGAYLLQVLRENVRIAQCRVLLQ